MGLHDRGYWREDGDEGPRAQLQYRLAFPRPGPATLGLMIACTVMFIAEMATGGDHTPLMKWLALPAGKCYEVWRLVTFQFLHASLQHFLMNMMGLYFFGTPLEKSWGARKFLGFYLGCGVFAGLCFVVIANIWEPGAFLVGASGGILAVLMACAVLFPQMLVFIFPIRVVVGIMAVVYLGYVVMNQDLSDAAHLGGMVAAVLYLWLPDRLGGIRRQAGISMRNGAWKRKMQQMQQMQDDQAAIDRILDKIKRDGIGSLSEKERRALQDATRRQQRQENRAGRL